MAVFVIGDLHLSLGSDKPMDIFKGWDNHTQKLERNWREKVSDGDTVVVPGDISWATYLPDALADLAFIDALPGKKILMRGNHDYWWPTLTKLRNLCAKNGLTTLDFLYNNSHIAEGLGIVGSRSWFFDEEDPDALIFLRELGRLRASIASLDFTQCSDVAAFLHYPPVFLGKAVDEVIGILKEAGIRRCYYGHLHGDSIPLAFSGNHEGIEMRLVSSDALGFAPLRIR